MIICSGYILGVLSNQTDSELFDLVNKVGMLLKQFFNY